jgi:hypothetical protein
MLIKITDTPKKRIPMLVGAGREDDLQQGMKNFLYLYILGYWPRGRVRGLQFSGSSISVVTLRGT